MRNCSLFSGCLRGWGNKNQSSCYSLVDERAPAAPLQSHLPPASPAPGAGEVSGCLLRNESAENQSFVYIVGLVENQLAPHAADLIAFC